MTEEQNKELKILRRNLDRKGLTVEQWEKLIELRKIFLTERGKNPDHYDLNSRFLTRKNMYIK